MLLGAPPSLSVIKENGQERSGSSEFLNIIIFDRKFMPPFCSFFFNKEEMLAPWKHACSNDCPFSVTYSGVVWALCRQRRKRRRK